VKGFRLNGKVFEAVPICRAALRIVEVLSKLPDGDLLNTSEAAQRTGYTVGSFNQYKTNPALAEYRAIVRFPSPAIVWGNPKTIRELRKHKEILA